MKGCYLRREDLGDSLPAGRLGAGRGVCRSTGPWTSSGGRVERCGVDRGCPHSGCCDRGAGQACSRDRWTRGPQFPTEFPGPNTGCWLQSSSPKSPRFWERLCCPQGPRPSPEVARAQAHPRHEPAGGLGRRGFILPGAQGDFWGFCQHRWPRAGSHPRGGAQVGRGGHTPGHLASGVPRTQRQKGTGSASEGQVPARAVSWAPHSRPIWGPAPRPPHAPCGCLWPEEPPSSPRGSGDEVPDLPRPAGPQRPPFWVSSLPGPLGGGTSHLRV